MSVYNPGFPHPDHRGLTVTTPKFAIFDHIEDIPGTPTSQLFKDRLALIKTADEAGFAGYHLAEHHGSELCMAPSPPRPFQERIPFWYPGSPQTAGQYGMSLRWPGKIDVADHEQYVAAFNDHKDNSIRMDRQHGRRHRVRGRHA
jgi:hypothetical protein